MKKQNKAGRPMKYAAPMKNLTIKVTEEQHRKLQMINGYGAVLRDFIDKLPEKP